MSLTLHLPYLEPWDWQQFHRHFALRLLPGVESLGERRYSRSVRVGTLHGWIRIEPVAGAPVLALTLCDSLLPAAESLGARVRRMFDLDADPQVITAHLGRDPVLAPLLAASPGLRVPAAYDPFEQAVRAVVGQQVSVKAAVTITRRLVERLGEPLPAAPDGVHLLFPSAEALAGATLDNIGMPAKRLAALQHLAEAVAAGRLQLDIAAGADELVRQLCRLPGIGPWTAEYIALRGFGAADAFPSADLGLLKAPLWGTEPPSANALAARAEAWRPWRAYAAVHIWQDYATRMPG
ncbi:DNA-3-methyladenine glycosylase family protein [Pseudomonas oligotrophica]|uniref:DNA-3-methyladenine glycosylase family protein n=1 Tax=Pseudomonas oligotrophica TaxID=2912055 RepID=UPI001F192A80|nr:AlkA N-terminal domain-containing protein [Pseudomonas oligotrophica]MCF7203391.1 DNA-3-methyladenine glycosylase 2 family protein [Pseudomonas oligotrophica]